MRDDIEIRGYGTNELVAGTDADGCDDLREAASVDENTVGGASDLGLIAAAFSNYGFPAPEEWRVNMDVDKNGAVNAADLGLAAAAFGSCGVLP